MTQTKFISILFLLGATAGSFYDGFHTYSNTTAYPDPIFLRMAWWVPLVFGLASVVIGVSHVDFEKFFKRRKHNLSWGMVIIGMIFFGGIYFASGFLEVGSSVKAIIFFCGAALLWLFFDSSWQGVFLAILTALFGSGVEILMTHYQTFYYLKPDFLGIPYWLPFLYMSASVAIGNFARKLQAPNKGGASFSGTPL